MIPYDLPPYFMLSWMFLYGAIIGSFLTVCVHRLPKHRGISAAWWSLVDNASHCDHCQQKLLACDNVPIFGWLLLGGRCRFCKTGIPIKYPLIELANGLLFAALYAMEVPLNYWNPLSESCVSSTLSPSTFENVWGLSPLVLVNCRYFYHLVLLEALFVASLIHWDTSIIPAAVTLPAMLAGIVGGAVFGQFWLVPVWFQDVNLAASITLASPTSWKWNGLLLDVPAWISRHPHWHGLSVSLAGMIVGGGLAWMINVVSRRTVGRDVMPWGEVFLVATVGSFIGWQPIVVALCLAPLLALMTAMARRLLHFGQQASFENCLIASAVVVLFGWRWIWPGVEWYFSLGPVFLILGIGIASAILPIMSLSQSLRRKQVVPVAVKHHE